MTNEEMQQTIRFILEAQARTAAQVEALTEAQRTSQRETDERLRRAEERWARTEEGIRALLAVAEMHEQELNKQREELARLARVRAEAQERVDRQMAETDERLNALIEMVERFLSKGQNGE